MLRDITLGQYYPVDSLIHRLDPRTKLFGTMVFILSLFVANNIWGYLLGTIALAAVIVLTKVPVRFILKGLKAIVILLLISVSFNLFLHRDVNWYVSGSLRSPGKESALQVLWQCA